MDYSTYIALVAELDKAELLSIAATLAGLCVAAASLLLGFAGDIANKARTAKADLDRAIEKTNSATGQEKCKRKAAEDLDRKEYEKLESQVNDTSSAMRDFVWAFYFFTGCLINELTLDRFVENDFLESIKLHDSYELLAQLDVALSYGLFGCGLISLWRGAREILKLVPYKKRQVGPAS